MLDLLFRNGTILTQDRRRPHAEALGVRAGRIVSVGSLADVSRRVGPDTRTVDLGGATLLPGFNDAHVHLWKVGQLRVAMKDVRGVRSLPELAAMLREFAATLPPGVWLQARGYNEATLAEGRHPTREDLDQIATDRPIYLIRTCAHIAVANSRALELAGIAPGTDPPPGGEIGRDEAGEPTGLLHETALGLVTRVIPPPTQAEYEAMILAGIEHQLDLGITAATDPAVTPELIEAYMALDTRGALPSRVNLLAIRRPDGGTETLPLPRPHRSDFLRLDGVKFFADGGLSGATAALSVPYRHAPTQGVLRFEREELLVLAREAHRAGLRIGTHAIGDAAIEQVLGVYEQLRRESRGPRHRIEHLGLPTGEHLTRIAAAGVIVVTQPVFLHDLGINFSRYLPAGWEHRPYPFRSMLEAGTAVAFSSDAPVVRDDNPLLGIRCALLRQAASGTRIGPAEAIGAEQALAAFTRGGALASGDEDRRGILAPGYDADIVILSGNPLNTTPEELTALRVLAVYVAGRQVRGRS